MKVSEDENAVYFTIEETSSREIPELKMNDKTLDRYHIYHIRVVTSGDDVRVNGNPLFYRITILGSDFLKGKKYDNISLAALTE